MNENHALSICYICYREFPDTNFNQYSYFVAENGHDVTVVSYLLPGQKELEYSSGRRVLRIQLPGDIRSKRSKKLFIEKCVQLLRSEDFDIVHIHSSFEYFGFIKLFARVRAKFIYHTTSHPVSLSRIRILKRKGFDFFQSLLMDAIFIQSQELKERLPGIRDLQRTMILPVGYNHRLFHPLSSIERCNIRRVLGINNGRIILVYTGILGKLRRLDRLIKGFAAARSAYKELTLLMVGDGAALTELQVLSKSLGILQDVVFTGQVPHETVVHYLGASDIGLSFVPINESFNYNPPLKTFEYLACGLPVIATRTKSNSKIVTDRFNGVLIDDTAEGLCESIVRLTQETSQLKLMARNACTSVVNFNFEKITKDTLIPAYHNFNIQPRQYN